MRLLLIVSYNRSSVFPRLYYGLIVNCVILFMSVVSCGLFALVATRFKKRAFWDTPGRLANGHRRSGGACFLRFRGLLDYIGYKNGDRQVLRHVGNYIYQSTLRRVL